MADKLEYKVPFYIIANDIFELGLNPYQIAVYSYLCRCANNSTAFPSYQTIANKTGMSKRKAINTVKELSDINLIQKVERKKSSDENDSNVYHVKLPSEHCAPPSDSSAPPSECNAPNKELLKKNYLKRTNNIGKIGKQSPAYTIKDYYDLYQPELTENTLEYLKCYLANSPEQYTADKWEDIILSLNSQDMLQEADKEEVSLVVNAYFNTKFKTHTLYHSTMDKVLENRCYEKIYR